MTSKRNAKHVVQLEVMLLMTAMKRRMKGNTMKTYQEENLDPLYRNLSSLKSILSQINDLSELKPLEYLSPFLDVISSGEMIGLITGLALSAVEKFLSFRYVDISMTNDNKALQIAIESLANTVTNTKFVGTDNSSDEVILMKILRLLDTLMHVPAGYLISDYAVCKIISSCFRICFEAQLSELLRHTAECTLEHIVHLLFTRLPDLKEDTKIRKNNLTINMDLSALSSKSRLRRKDPISPESHSDQYHQLEDSCSSEDAINMHHTPDKSCHFPDKTIDEISTDLQPDEPINHVDSSEDFGERNEIDPIVYEPESQILFELTRNESTSTINTDIAGNTEQSSLTVKSDNIQYRTEKGIVFKSDISNTVDNSDSENANGKGSKPDKIQSKQKIQSSTTPYGLACVQKLFSNLISILAPENISNTNHVRTGLTLITAAFESGAEYISNAPNNLLAQIQNELSKNLILLLQSDRLSFFAASARVCFLMFESMRRHLKFQLEMYLSRLISIVMPDNENIPYEYREVALESIVQLWRIPTFITELYLNYDCDLYCTDLLQELAELFCKIATPDRTVRCLMNTQVIALDALLFMINSVNTRKDDINRAIYYDSDSQETNPEKKIKLTNPILQKKRLLRMGTEKFNNDMKDGLKYLRSQGFCQTNAELALFFRENPRLSKAFIGEYVCNRLNVEAREEYIKLFDLRGLRIDCAIRMFLEEFRLPGEAANIQLILECFALAYFTSNPGIVSDLDSTFVLLYAIVMLNVDQHNPNSKKQQVPMTVDQFKRNVWNSSEKRYFGNIEEETLNKVYEGVRTEEIVMPAEQRGMIKDNYLWRQLLRRCTTSNIPYVFNEFKNHSYEMFNLVWKSAVNAFVYVFEGEMNPLINESMTLGLHQCASIAAYYNLCEIMDKIIIYIAKYTIFSSPQETVEAFGKNAKTKLAAKSMFHIAQKHGDILRDGWKNLLDCLLCLFKAKLLPKNLTEVDDFISKDKIILLIEEDKSLARTETTSVINWFYSLTSSDYSSGQRNQEDEITKNEALNVINECLIPALIEETRFLKEASLTEFINALINGTRLDDDSLIKTIHHRQTQKNNQSTNVIACENSSWVNGRDEQSRVFCLELMMRVLLHNSDRISSFLSLIHDHFYTVLIGSVRPDFLLERTVVASLRLAIQLLRKQDVDQVFTCLEILALTKNSVLKHVNLHVVCGLYDLIYMHAANIPSEKDWKLLLTLIEICGAGTKLDPIYKADIVNRLRKKQIASLKKIKSPKSVHDHGESLKLSDHECSTDHQEVCNSIDDIPNKLSIDNSDQHPDHQESGRGYTSDSELYKTTNQGSLNDISSKWDFVSPSEEFVAKNRSAEYIGLPQSDNVKLYSEYPLPIVNQFNIVLTTAHFTFKDPLAIEKSCEILSYLVRDPAHITPTNFEPCVHTLRVFAEACVKSSLNKKTVITDKSHNQNNVNRGPQDSGKLPRSRSNNTGNMRKATPNAKLHKEHHQYSDIDSDDEPHYKISAQIDKGSINENLLDLMHTLHNRAAKIYFEWNNTEMSDADIYVRLWKNCWCPLLQGMARLCCDVRPEVRTIAMTFLQRSLLSPVLTHLTGAQWEDCFAKVLFPLLSNFLENIKSHNESVGTYNQIENSDPRMRAVQILTKVFLQHLGPLHELSTFTALWLTILEYMDSYMKANNNSDSLDDAVRESLKNVLLVMYTGTQDRAILIKSDDESGQLLKLTCDRLSTFLPDLAEELFSEQIPSSQEVTGDIVNPPLDQNEIVSPDSTESSQPLQSGEEIIAENAS